VNKVTTGIKKEKQLLPQTIVLAFSYLSRQITFKKTFFLTNGGGFNP
jgi:hypothetical protein